jgi:hypothetical protein
MQFGTKAVKIRRYVKHCCLSVHNVTFILGSCNEICGHLDFVRFCVLLFSLWCVGILLHEVGDFCDVSVAARFCETSEHPSAAQRRNTQKGPMFVFCPSSAKNIQSTHNSTCTVIVCCLCECVSEWQRFGAECVKVENKILSTFYVYFFIIIFSVVQLSNWGLRSLIVEVSRSHN